jgi:hypothetical protein
MANQIIFNRGQGGLGRPLAGEDFVSSLLFYSATLPSGFASNDRIKQVFSVEEAENLGIVNTHVGETKATGTITVTGAGVVGDTIETKVNNGTSLVSIGTATVPATPTTTTVAAAIVTSINDGTTTHGYTASNIGPVVTLTAPAGTGVGANSYVISNVIVGTATTTLVQFSGGVASIIDVLYYHVAEYFRIQPKGDLTIGVYSPNVTFDEVVTIQNFAAGKIRQMGVYVHAVAFATSHLTTLQSKATQLESENKPLSIIYQGDFSAVTDLSTLSDLRALNNKNVSATIGQDYANEGAALYHAFGKSIGILGATLGAVSLSAVHESISWVGKFNVANTELDLLAFANGTNYRSVSNSLINNIDLKGYIFTRKHQGVDGSYFNDSASAISVSNDFAYIENNRTIDKAIRNMRAFLLPALSSPIKVNADGTLTEDSISYFETLAKRALEAMERDGELSAFGVTINPAQDVLATSKITIAVSLVPVGVARTIEVNVSFTTQIA